MVNRLPALRLRKLPNRLGCRRVMAGRARRVHDRAMNRPDTGTRFSEEEFLSLPESHEHVEPEVGVFAPG